MIQFPAPRLALAGALVAGFSLAGCGRAPATDAVVPVTPNAHATCASLRNARFRSLEQFPAGLGPDGPVLGHQYLSFAADGESFEWTMEDMSSSGGCSCRDGEITVSGSPFTNGKGFPARIEASGALSWNGIAFERAP